MSVKSIVKRRLRSALGTQQLDEKLDSIQSILSIAAQITPPPERVGDASAGSSMPTQRDERPRNILELTRRIVRQIADISKPGTIFTCHMNGLDLLAPMELVRMYPRCLHPSPEQPLTYWVETRQADWLRSKLAPGDVAFDVGASMGLITMGMARAVGVAGRVHAFEPQRTSRRHLESMLALNATTNVEVVAAAVSDAIGTAEFIEYAPDDECTWRAEASSLAAGAPSEVGDRRYRVDTTTIDAYVDRANVRPRAIKIDIEGFELDALRGATTTLKRFLPCLCIDIHKDPRTGESTRGSVESLLSSLGYRVYVKEYDMYAEHATT